MKIYKNNGLLYNSILFIVFPIFKIFYGLESFGQENIPENTRCLICPNHTSAVDPALIVLPKGKKLFFMAKAELFKNSFINKLLRYLGAFPVKRGQSDKSAIDRAIEILENDNQLVIFIEGERSKTGKPLRAKSGAALISFKTNTPIIPVGIATKDGKKVSPFKKIKVKFGNPIMPRDLGIISGTSEELKNASTLIMDNIKKLKEEAWT